MKADMTRRGTEAATTGGCLAEAWVEDPQVKFCAPNYSLGALPDKGDLMHDPAMDEELERL